ncbi:hypothetical protein [Elongatibacter sediminis]
MRYRINPPPVSPAARVLATLVGLLVLAAALFFGVIVLLIALGAMAGFGVYTWVRSRWPGRSSGRPQQSPERQPGTGGDIEGEYTVVSRRRE